MMANPGASEATTAFLQSSPGVEIKNNGHAYHITAAATVATWDALLNTTFYNYERTDENGKKTTIIRAPEYSLPESVAPYVSAVFNTVQFPIDLNHRSPVIRPIPTAH
jgi:subtilase family serine protease